MLLPCDPDAGNDTVYKALPEESRTRRSDDSGRGSTDQGFIPSLWPSITVVTVYPSSSTTLAKTENKWKSRD